MIMPGTAREEGSPLQRLARLLLGPNKQRRPSDRIEGAAVVLLSAAFLAAVAAASVVGMRIYPICTDIPFEVGKDLTTAGVAEILRNRIALTTGACGCGMPSGGDGSGSAGVLVGSGTIVPGKPTSCAIIAKCSCARSSEGLASPSRVPARSQRARWPHTARPGRGLPR